jgi:hypothetical protein
MKPEKAYPKKTKSIKLPYMLKATSLCRCKTNQALKSDGDEVGEEEERIESHGNQRRRWTNQSTSHCLAAPPTARRRAATRWKEEGARQR